MYKNFVRKLDSPTIKKFPLDYSFVFCYNAANMLSTYKGGKSS